MYEKVYIVSNLIKKHDTRKVSVVVFNNDWIIVYKPGLIFHHFLLTNAIIWL